MIQRTTFFAIVSVICASSACAPPAPVAREIPPCTRPAPEPRTQDTSCTLTLAPEPDAHLSVHLACALDGAQTFSIARAHRDIDGLSARDDGGPFAASVSPEAPNDTSTVRLGRPVRGRLELSFRVRASSDPRGPLAELVVAEDRARGLLRSCTPVPSRPHDTPREISLVVDGSRIAAEGAFTTLGVGRTRTRTTTFEALAYGMFVAGSLGTAAFRDAGDRDEVAWLGYTAFDPRPAAAEIAQVRTALRETWKGGGAEGHALAFVSSARPEGHVALLELPGATLVHLGPSEPWGFALRTRIALALQRPWLGGRLAVRSDDGTDGTWFDEGLARFTAVRLLSRLGLVAPRDVATWLGGLYAAHALSPFKDRRHTELLAARASVPEARAELATRGALHAFAVYGAYRRAHPGKTFDDELRPLVTAAIDGKKARFVTETEWQALLGRALGRETSFDVVALGKEPPVPDDALGPCFRKSAGAVFRERLGFDLDATLDAADRRLVGLEPGGAAFMGGAREGDVLVEASRTGETYRLVLESAGTKRTSIVRPNRQPARATTFVREPKVPDTACGELL